MTTIYGPDGRPISVKDLKREIAAPTLQGVRSVWTETMVSGMTPSKLAAVLRGAAANEITEFLTLAEQMEEIDPHYGSVLGTRKLAVSSLEPHISVRDDDDARANEIADACREIVEAPGFKVALSGLLDALGKGFSVVEVHWDYSSSRWTPAAFEWRDPRFFQFDKRTGRQVRLREEGSTEGVELPAAKFMIHFPNLKCGLPIRGGLARLAAWTWLYKNYTIKDWMTFLEVYGMPIRLGRYGPSATEDDRRKLLKAVANIGTDAAAIVPQGMDIEFVESKGGGTGGSAVFSGMADYLDKQVSKGVLGQTMTTDDGASLAQAQVHEEVRGDIRESDAGWLEATINRDLIRPFVDLNFGLQEHYPWFTLPIPEAEDLKAFTTNVTAFMKHGLEVSASQIRDKFGLDMPTDAEDTLSGRASPPAISDAPDGDVTQAAKTHVCPGCGGVHDLALLRRGDDGDELDALIGEALADWDGDIAGIIAPIRAVVAAASDFDDLVKSLNRISDEMDAGALIARLGPMLFKARGLGDATDTPSPAA